MLPQLAHANTFSPESRVWVYTCNRRLTDTETQQVQAALHVFTKDWTAHNQALKAAVEVFENQCIILMVDESQAGASGCSIDKSVHFLEQLGQHLHVDFFERMCFAWADEHDSMHFANRTQLAAARQTGEVSDNTLMMNSLVQNRKDLLEKWLVPFGESWHRRVV